MGITLSHYSALHAIRLLRCAGHDIQTADHTTLFAPSPWEGKRWTIREFRSDQWKWQMPSKAQKLDVLIESATSRLRMDTVCNHVCSSPLPANALLWIDDNTAIASPCLLFVQLAEVVPLGALVMLGNELCGGFSRCADNPQSGPVSDGIRPATSVADLRAGVDGLSTVSGSVKARKALRYVCDNAISVPEAILAAMYSLPVAESGYGMGPVTLNQRVGLDDLQPYAQASARYPDLMFSFAPIGINYDGGDHLDIDGLVKAARDMYLADDEHRDTATLVYYAKRDAVRQKVVDDVRRTRELAARGKIVFPATREDLYEHNGLERLTRTIVACARSVFGTDTSVYEAMLDDSELARERQELLDSLLSRDSARVLRSGVV